MNNDPRITRLIERKSRLIAKLIQLDAAMKLMIQETHLEELNRAVQKQEQCITETEQLTRELLDLFNSGNWSDHQIQTLKDQDREWKQYLEQTSQTRHQLESLLKNMKDRANRKNIRNKINSTYRW